MPCKATRHQASLPCYERAILLPTYTGSHTRTRAQSELVYGVFCTEFSDCPVLILKIYSKIKKKTEMLMLFNVMFVGPCIIVITEE